MLRRMSVNITIIDKYLQCLNGIMKKNYGSGIFVQIYKTGIEL